MQVKKNYVTDTTVELTITADAKHLEKMKAHVLQKLAPQVKVQGFRQGNIPLTLVEKNIDNNVLQTEFLDEAVNHMYGDALDNLKIRPVSNPQVTISKFVPFTDLEFIATVEIVGEISMPDYTRVKLARKQAEVTDKDVSGVIESLRGRMAERVPSNSGAADGDEVIIDFKGTDEKGEPVKGGDGKDYPLVLGSKTFIPGFEENIIGMKAGDSKTFDITFPKDYGVAALQKKKVSFEVIAKLVNTLVKPKIDDDFAKKAGPFADLKSLKADIKKQLSNEKQYELDREYENQLIQSIADKTKVAIPKLLIDEQVDRLYRDIQQNAVYRGQTMQEFLEAEGMDEATYKEKQLVPEATKRVKGGLILSEIAEQEKISVTPEELQVRLELLKGQYQDQQMRAELDKPENQRDIAARILTEKTIAKLVGYAS